MLISVKETGGLDLAGLSSRTLQSARSVVSCADSSSVNRNPSRNAAAPETIKARERETHFMVMLGAV